LQLISGRKVVDEKREEGKQSIRQWVRQWFVSVASGNDKVFFLFVSTSIQFQYMYAISPFTFFRLTCVYSLYDEFRQNH
jgi:hypothetical protein